MTSRGAKHDRITSHMDREPWVPLSPGKGWHGRNNHYLSCIRSTLQGRAAMAHAFVLSYGFTATATRRRFVAFTTTSQPHSDCTFSQVHFL
jgi:hypothetical protein